MPNYKVVDAGRLDAAMTATADAIREKTSGTDSIPWNADTGFAEAVAGITGGGAAVSVPMKDVNFYDYDGTRLYSYTVEEAAALAELPPLPTQPGLICQGWNWTLDAVKAMGREVDVGATYITDDGKTRIYITLTEGRTSPMLGCCPNGTVTVDWGDGTEPDVLTGTSVSTVQWTPNHDYSAAGDYVITLTVNGEMRLYGDATNDNGGILRYSNGVDDRNAAYRNCVRSVELGGGITIINAYAFQNCTALKSITIPDGVTSTGMYAFSVCSSLKAIVLPHGFTKIENSVFISCGALATIAIPASVTSVGMMAFSADYALSNIVFPDGLKSISGYAFMGNLALTTVVIPDGVTSTGTSAFSGCSALASVVLPSGLTSIGTNLFEGCWALVSIRIPGNIKSIAAKAFYQCYGVKRFDFSECTSVPTLSNVNAFTGIANDCEICVPVNLVDTWKAATNWSTYADYIVGV